MIKALADGPPTPDVSTENGTKWWPDASDAYLLRFRSSAEVAGDPGLADKAVMSKDV